MSQLMKMPHRPTAVFCGSDILATGTLEYCRANDVKFPEYVSVMGVFAAEYAFIKPRKVAQELSHELDQRLIV